MANPVPSTSPALLAATNGRVPRRFVPRIAVTFAALLASPAVHAQSSGDSLQWIGGTANSSWTSTNNVWNDTGAVQAGPGPISLSSTANQALTYGFFFIGNNSTVGTVAPNVMSIDQTLNANFISFLDGFAANNTTTIGRTVNDGLAKPLNLVTGWQIADRGVGGTVNFAQYATNNSPGQFGGLYFNLTGAGGITAVTGSNVVLNVNVAGSGSLSVDKPVTDNGVGGTVTLVVNNNNGNGYGGGTTVQAGTLVIAGGSNVTSATGTGAITVNSGGTLAGNGVGDSNTTVNSGGLLAPGTTVAPIGRLTLGGGGLNSGLTINGTLGVDIGGGGTTASVNNDQVTLSTGGTYLALIRQQGLSNLASSEIDFRYNSATERKGDPSFLRSDANNGGPTYANSVFAGDPTLPSGGDGQIGFTVNMVPEPRALPLVLAGMMLAMAGMKRVRSRWG